MADRSPDNGPGNHRAPPLRRTPLDNRSTLRAGSGRVSDAMARLSKRRCGSQRGDTIADRPPWETPGPPSYAARRSADISVLFLVPYRDRAAAFALPGQCSGITRVISAWRQKHMPPLSPTTTTVLCLAASVHLVCGPRPW